MRVAVVGSPPYESHVIRARDIGKPGFVQGATQGQHSCDAYGDSPGQLGALPSGTLDARPVPVTPAPVTTWQGCYGDSWQDLIGPESFAHPAKFSRGLIHRIYRHMLEQGHIREGVTVLDPFGGVALGALDAMTYGLRWIGCELEPRFVALGQQNLELWRQRYGFTGSTIVQGDSRRLREVLAGAQVQAVVGSPPYEGSLHSEQNGIDRQKSRTPGGTRISRGAPPETSYGTTPGQLGAMPPGVVVSSPPYEGSAVSALSPVHASGGQGNAYRRTGQSPRARQAMVEEQYGCSPGQLGAEPDTFWSAAAQIMQELALLLPAGAVCAWVLKSYVSKGKIVPFPQQWQALCEAHGFVLVEEIHASLVEDHGTQEGLFGDSTQVRTEKKSFFRRLAEKKGSPRIDHETVLIVRKAGSGAGMCCVSSPPFAESLSASAGIDKAERQRVALALGKTQAEVTPADLAHAQQNTYGTTPGNLGNMAVGMCVVSSPPFAGCLSGTEQPEKLAGLALNTDGSNRLSRSARSDTYGTTPGNLGNLPVGSI